jgi:hypothetical protein
MNEIDECWTRRVEVGRLPLPIEGEQDVALIWLQVPENCGRGHREIGLGVMKDDAKRVYAHAKACYFTPKIIITIAVTAPNTIPGEQVGVVEDAQRDSAFLRVTGVARTIFVFSVFLRKASARSATIWTLPDR